MDHTKQKHELGYRFPHRIDSAMLLNKTAEVIKKTNAKPPKRYS